MNHNLHLTRFLDTALGWSESNLSIGDLLEWLDDEWGDILTEDVLIASLYALKHIIIEGEIQNVELI